MTAAGTLAAALALSSAPHLGAANGPTVQVVEIRVAMDGGLPAPPIRLRLQETVETVAQRLLVGRPVDQLRASRPQLQATLTSIIDRVVGGYAVVGTFLDPGPRTQVAVRLRPDGPLIQSLELQMVPAVHSAVAALVADPATRAVGPAANGLLVGLPVEALDWAGPLVADQLRRTVEEALPGFTGEVQITPGAAARVKVDLVPRDTRVVRNIGVQFRSSTIPTVLLQRHEPQVTSLAEPLRGLPVLFAERQRAALEQLIDARLRGTEAVQQYHILVRSSVRVGETASITVLADSVLYRGRVEAIVNVGSRAPAPELRLHLGRLVGSIEVFGEAAFVPNTLSGRYDLGFGYRVTEAIDVGTNIPLNATGTIGWLTYRLSPDLSVRGGYEMHHRLFEGSVRYRFNEFFSGELVGTSGGEYWVRIISNL